MAVEYRLPIRLSGESTQRNIGFPFRTLAAEEGVLFPDHFVPVGPIGSRRVIEKAVFDLDPGVTEIQVRPAIDTPELRAIGDNWAGRVDDLDLVTSADLRSLLERAGRDPRRLPRAPRRPASRVIASHPARRSASASRCARATATVGRSRATTCPTSRPSRPSSVELGDDGFDVAELEIRTDDLVEFINTGDR